MKVTDLRRYAAVVAASIAVLGVSVAAASADIVSDYHPATEARTFATSPGGWTSKSESSGTCASQVNCPTVDNSWQPAGGAGGEGFLRTAMTSLSTGGGEVRGVWESPVFTYTGARGTVPDALTFYMDRRADVSALLTLQGGEAQFTVDLEDLSTGSAVNVTGPSPLPAASGWRGIPAVHLDPAQLILGHDYKIRITTRFAYGAALVPEANADYDNVLLEARDSSQGNAGRAPGLNTALLNASGRKLFIKVKCPQKARPDHCRIKAVALTKRKGGKKMTKLKKGKVRAGKRKIMLLHVKPQYQNTLRASTRVLVRIKNRYKHKTHKVTKNMVLKHI